MVNTRAYQAKFVPNEFLQHVLTTYVNRYQDMLMTLKVYEGVTINPCLICNIGINKSVRHTTYMM